MIKLYTDQEYLDKTIEASNNGKKLYVHTFTQEVEEERLCYEYIEEEYQEPVLDENSEPMLDENGEPIMETKTRIVKKLIMVDVEEEIPIFDEEGNQIGTDIIVKQVQKTETVMVEKTFAELIMALDGYYVCYKNNFTDGTVTENFEHDKLIDKKLQKIKEASDKAKKVIENGFVTFKDAQFETNTQTLSDLKSVRDLCVALGYDYYDWLSKDDQIVRLKVDNYDLTEDDFINLGLVVQEFKNDIWVNGYLKYKYLIEQINTIEGIDNLVIDYSQDIDTLISQYEDSLEQST